MKKTIVIIMAAVLAMTAFVINADAAKAPPKLVYEPVTVTARTGSNVEMRTVAEGTDLVFSWSMLTCEDGNDHVFDLTKTAGVTSFEKQDGSGKMKVRFKTNKLENDRVESLLIIENIIEFNYGVTVMCTVSNGSSSVECDKAIIYTSYNAPPIPLVEMIADFSVRLNKLVKLSCFPYIPKGAGYTDDDIVYDWYQTPDGSKENGVYLDEHDPVLMAEAYTSGVGDYYFFCQMYIKIGSDDFMMDTGVTVMHVYYPDIRISFDKETVILDKGEKAVLNLSVSVLPEKDKGELTYQWYLGTDPDSIFGMIPGAKSDSYTVKGYNSPDVEYYTVIVTNTTSDDFSYDNLMAEKAFVKVIHTGEDPLKIKKMPGDVTADENENISFSVSADGAASYEWFAQKPDGSEAAVKAGENGVISGENKDTLIVKAGRYNNGLKYFCKLKSKSGKELTTDLARLTVNVAAPETPKVNVTPDQITAGLEENVVLTANATVSDGGTLTYQWYAVEGSTMTAIEGAVNGTYEPERTAGKKQYCVCVVNVIGETQSLPVISNTVTVEFKEAQTAPATSGDSSTDTAKTPGTTSGESDGGNSKPIIIILISTIALLCVALAVTGIIVLSKYGKKKK